MTKRNTEERFWSMISIMGEDDCWNWNGKPDNEGYGIFHSILHKTTLAHRLAFIFSNGEIDDNLFVLHTCDNTLCCNPNHLYLGKARSVKRNIKDIEKLYYDNGYMLLSNYDKNDASLIFSDYNGYLYKMPYGDFYANIVKRGTFPAKFDISNIFTIYNVRNFLLLNRKTFHLDENEVWKGSKYKMTFFDDDDYFYSLQTDNVIAGIENNKTFNRFDSGNSYTIYNISNWLLKSNSPIEIIENQTFINEKSDLEFRCLRCKPDEFHFMAKLDKILHGGGCPFCSGHQIGKYNNLEYLFPEIAAEWDYSKNKVKPNDVSAHNSRMFYWICPDCGKSYPSIISNRTGEIHSSCPSCQKSKGEITVENFLIENNIDYIPQCRFDGCRNKRKLPFDFYIPDFNVAIEFHGKQHYEDTPFYGSFEDRKKRDLIKENYCFENNIQLIIIPYWDESNIINILFDKLNIL